RASKHGDDELGRFIDGFNAMLAEIQKQDRALQDAREHLEKRVADRTAALQLEVAERERAQAILSEQAELAALAGEVGLPLHRAETLPAMLQQCAESIVHHLDAAFARIWTLNTRDQILELKASAGLYTHLDGPHGRVPVGKFKIGLIAHERRPHLTNSVIGD